VAGSCEEGELSVSLNFWKFVDYLRDYWFFDRNPDLTVMRTKEFACVSYLTWKPVAGFCEDDGEFPVPIKC
jgi:hypothetical protein